MGYEDILQWLEKLPCSFMIQREAKNENVVGEYAGRWTVTVDYVSGALFAEGHGYTLTEAARAASFGIPRYEED